MSILLQAVQIAPQPAAVDWTPVILQIVITLGALTPFFIGLGLVILRILNAAAERQEKNFAATLKRSVEVELLLTAATVEITRLGAIAQSVDGLKAEVARLQTDYTSLRTASDAERVTTAAQITAYQKELAARDETIKALKDSTDATIQALQDRITDLEATVKSLIEQRDRLQDDKAARVEMSKHGADTATLERMMSDAKAEMIQAEDEPPGDAA